MGQSCQSNFSIWGGKPLSAQPYLYAALFFAEESDKTRTVTALEDGIREYGNAQLEALLFPRAAPLVERHAAPDFAHMHQELKRKGVTLMLLWEEYATARVGEAYRYSQFDPAHDPPGLRFSPGEEEASVNIRPITRSPGPLPHLLPAPRIGEAGS